MAATKKYYDEIGAFAKTNTPSMCCPGPEHGWIDFTAVAEVSGAAPQEAEPLVPKLITYDRAGAPENAQDSRDQGEQEPKWTQFPWKEWQRSAAAQALDEEASDIAAITLALRTLHSSPQLREMLDNLWLNDSRQKKSSQVVWNCRRAPRNQERCTRPAPTRTACLSR